MKAIADGGANGSHVALPAIQEKSPALTRQLRRAMAIRFLGPACDDSRVNAIVEQAETVASDLKDGRSIAVENLLADTAGSLWLLWHISELQYPDKAYSIHRRYIASLRTLAAIRRVDSVQVTITAKGRRGR